MVSVDGAKARSKWMRADFYGNVLVPSTEVAHHRVELEATVAQIRAALFGLFRAAGHAVGQQPEHW